MKKPDKKLIITGALLLPLLLLSIYTFKGAAAPKKPAKVVVPQLKLTTPSEDSDEVSRLIMEGDYETALSTIDKNLKDANIPTSKGIPLLVLAAQQNNYDIATVLIAKGSDANFADVNTGETALIKAARNGNIDMMNLLIVAGADVNAPSKMGVTPLLAGIESGKRAVTEFLVSRGGLSGVSQENLIKYAFQKNYIGVEAMLKGGAQPNYADKNGNTALIAAAANGDMESLKVLLAYRADINAANKFKMTPLLYAVKTNNTELAKYLLDRQADVKQINTAGETALYLAASAGNLDLVNILLTLGSDYNAVAANGLTALKAAQKNGHTAVAKLISDFIAYKSIPRDSKGRPILPKKKSSYGASAQTAAPAGAMPSSLPAQPSGSGQGAPAFDMSALMGGKVDPAQMAAAQASAQQGGQAQPAQNPMQPKDSSQVGKTPQKTVINKLRTSSL